MLIVLYALTGSTLPLHGGGGAGRSDHNPHHVRHHADIEDDAAILRFVGSAWRQRPDWRLVGHSDTYVHAQVMAPNSLADVFLVDLGLPEGRGEDLLRQLAAAKPDVELLVFTVFGDEPRLIHALQAGATGYVLKGCSERESGNQV